ncbi:unnamed protein product [Brachionus calyciflorus]|uniref:Ataxin-3 homolog n=1 Tax=Brachionus calyciflorus TaxID=104777 RepID=A0A813ZC98_9BILA|nr:unnamed protein product [Brachionus calyciflorus]
MEFIFHETQDGLLCAQHCLNSLLQGDYYSAVDLANIAHDLDKVERDFMHEASTTSQESSNYDDTGFFSIQVIQNALKSWNLELIPFKSSNDLAKLAREYPTEQKAYICNYQQHWYTIRKIGSYWFNLNSMFKKPELISDTYLAILLKQLEHDGYSIFIVDGDLPVSQADIHLQNGGLNVKEILQMQTFSKDELKKSGETLSSEGFDDDELKKALRMSLAENDLQQHGELYPSLSHQNEEDDELKRAIELSLQANSKSSEPELSAEEIRQKRLEFWQKQN